VGDLAEVGMSGLNDLIETVADMTKETASGKNERAPMAVFEASSSNTELDKILR
jgi:hypothetical protein